MVEKFQISLPKELKDKGQKESKKLFGKVNLSGFIAYLINKHKS